MGFFQGMKGTQATVKSAYIAPGLMINRIDRIKLQKSQQDDIEFIAVEQTVLVQQTKESPAYPDGSKVPLNQTGERVFQQFKGGDKKKDEMARGNFKAFLMGVYGCDESVIDDDDGPKACAPDQPAAGRFVLVNAVAGKTKANKPFTYVNYVRPVSARELLQLIDPAVKAKLFPGDVLEQMAAAQEAQG